MPSLEVMTNTMACGGHGAERHLSSCQATGQPEEATYDARVASHHLATTLVVFDATVHRTKNRLVAIPAKVQRRLGLVRRPNNHIVLYSIRCLGRGRWNHHLAYLTHDNEFAIPADVTHIEAGAHVEVKIHRVIPDADALGSLAPSTNPGALLLAMAEEAGEDERVDGSERVDEYLYGSANG
jgi:hypothetical protein